MFWHSLGIVKRTGQITSYAHSKQKIVWQRKQLCVRNFLCSMGWGPGIKSWGLNIFHQLPLCRPTLRMPDDPCHRDGCPSSSFWVMLIVFQLPNFLSLSFPLSCAFQLCIVSSILKNKTKTFGNLTIRSSYCLILYFHCQDLVNRWFSSAASPLSPHAPVLSTVRFYPPLYSLTTYSLL